jgi:acyl carrier protein
MRFDMQQPDQDQERLAQLVIDSLSAVAPEINPDALDPNATFRDQFEIDSVDYLNFVIGLEKRLGRRIPETDFPQLSSLAGCLRYLRSGGS